MTTLPPQLKAALREKLKEFGTNYEWPYRLMRDNNRSPADQQQEAQMELLESFLVDLEQTLQPEIERLVVEGQIKAMQRLNYDLIGLKDPEQIKRFVTSHLGRAHGELRALTQSNPQKGEL